MKLILTALLSAILFCSCESITGSGNIVTETRNPGQFTGIKNSGSIDVEVTNDTRHSVKVEADDNIIEYVITKIENGSLNIYLKNNLSYRNTNIKVYVSSPVVQQLSVSGSGQITGQNILKDDERIACKVSGSGDIDVAIDAPAITSDITGSGQITLKGRTKNFSANVSGSGDLKAENLLAENTVVKVSGSGTAHVYASIILDAKVSGSGDIFYSGNPTSPQIKKSGSGSIQASK